MLLGVGEKKCKKFPKLQMQGFFPRIALKDEDQLGHMARNHSVEKLFLFS